MAVGCCVFLHRGPSFSRSGYRPLTIEDGYESGDEAMVTVVVGKERRVFVVSPVILRSDPFKILMKEIGKVVFDGGNVIFVDVDSILFEHLIWLAGKNECPALLRFYLKELVEFYSQDC